MDGDLQPLGPDTVDLLATALAADADFSDVAMFTRVFTAGFGRALPPGVVEIENSRTVGDRLAGRPGTAVRLTLTFPERRLELRAARGWPEAEVPVEEWVRQLAAELTALAERNSSARAALASLLGTD
jgi:hypothetical protein